MKTLGNIIWLLFGGIFVALLYYLVGLLFCITIIGIPFGLQLFKFGSFALWPFGRTVVSADNDNGCLCIFMNILWILLGWWEIAATHISLGIIFCITIIGIPLGLQHFKIAIASVLPFGKKIVSEQ